MSFWSELRDVVDCDGELKYVVWNNKEIKIDSKVEGMYGVN